MKKLFASTSDHTDPWYTAVSQPVLGTRSGKGVSLFMVCSGLWAVSLEAWPDLSHASPVHITPGFCMGRQCGPGLSSRPREKWRHEGCAFTSGFSLGTLKEQLHSFTVAL